MKKRSRAQRPRPRKSNRALYQTAGTPSRNWDCLRISDTRRLAVAVVSQRLPNLWLLRGPVGSGKTTFVRAVTRSLGVVGPITSPTFVLRHDYPTRHPVWHHVVHIDAYRVRGRREKNALDVVSATNDPLTLVLVEWPENLGLSSGRSSLTITFAHRPVGRRLVFSRPV